MALKRAFKQGLQIMSEPSASFKALKTRTFEDVLEDYMKLLLLSGFLAGAVSFIYQFSTAAYLSFFQGVSIDYWRLANYSLGNSTGIFFFYLFAGTLLIFLLSLIIRIFAPKMKLVNLISIVLYSLTPFLFFGWIVLQLSLSLAIWCIFLLVTGFRKH